MQPNVFLFRAANGLGFLQFSLQQFAEVAGLQDIAVILHGNHRMQVYIYLRSERALVISYGALDLIAIYYTPYSRELAAPVCAYMYEYATLSLSRKSETTCQ